MRSGIYIDDAATPGTDSKSAFLPENRRSFCAVVVPEQVHSHIETGMAILLNGIKEEFNADEVHCTDIYSGRGPWKGVSVKQRMQIFDLMTNFFEKFHLPVEYQTVSNQLYNDKPYLKKLNSKKGCWWNLQD